MRLPISWKGIPDGVTACSAKANNGESVVEPTPVYEEPNTITISEIHKLLKTASKTYQDDDGWVNAGAAGSYIKRARPDFDIKAYGYDKLLELLNDYPDKYETKKQQVGKGIVVTYRIKK